MDHHNVMFNLQSSISAFASAIIPFKIKFFNCILHSVYTDTQKPRDTQEIKHNHIDFKYHHSQFDALRAESLLRDIQAADGEFSITIIG